MKWSDYCWSCFWWLFYYDQLINWHIKYYRIKSYLKNTKLKYSFNIRNSWLIFFMNSLFPHSAKSGTLWIKPSSRVPFIFDSQATPAIVSMFALALSSLHTSVCQVWCTSVSTWVTLKILVGLESRMGALTV